MASAGTPVISAANTNGSLAKADKGALGAVENDSIVIDKISKIMIVWINNNELNSLRQLFRRKGEDYLVFRVMLQHLRISMIRRWFSYSKTLSTWQP